MCEKHKTQALEQVYRICFAFLVGIGAVASLGIKTGRLSIGIATGIAVFLIFGLEFDQQSRTLEEETNHETAYLVVSGNIGNGAERSGLPGGRNPNLQ